MNFNLIRIYFQLLNSQLNKNQQQSLPLQSQAPPRPPSEPPMQIPPAFNAVGPLGPVQNPLQSQMQHENLMKVLQIQQQQQQQKQRQQQSEMLSMMMHNAAAQQQSQRMIGASPIPQDIQMMVNNAPSNRDLLNRPEAESIIRGLQQGDITRQHLVQQLQVRLLVYILFVQ